MLGCGQQTGHEPWIAHYKDAEFSSFDHWETFKNIKMTFDPGDDGRFEVIESGGKAIRVGTVTPQSLSAEFGERILSNDSTSDCQRADAYGLSFYFYPDGRRKVWAWYDDVSQIKGWQFRVVGGKSLSLPLSKEQLETQVGKPNKYLKPFQKP